MEKVIVKVCTGTTCFVMGGANLQELADILPRKYGDNVNVELISCLGKCSVDYRYAKAPYVKVNNEFIEEATVEKVLEAVNRKLG